MITDHQYTYFDLPDPRTVLRWAEWGFIAAIALVLVWLAVTA